MARSAGISRRTRERKYTHWPCRSSHAITPPGLLVSCAGCDFHELASPDRRIWSHIAVAFATAYAVLISVTYYVQLTLVAPRIATGRTEGIEPFLFTPFDSFFHSVDLLGYSFMSVATLFAARVFTGGGPERVARLFLMANGLLLPFLALKIHFHWMIWIAALWAVTFPGSTLALAVLFRRAQTTATRAERPKAPV